MVLTRRVGVQRSYPMVLLLYVVTFSYYGAYWHYKTHKELYDQFELQRERKQDGFLWVLFGYAMFRPLLWVYQWILISNLRHVRERLGFSRTISVGSFLSLTIGGSVIILAGLFASLLVTGEVDEDQPADEQFVDAAAGMGVLLLFAIGGAAMQITAFALLQRDVNQVWSAYDRRMEELMPATPPPAPGPSYAVERHW